MKMPQAIARRVAELSYEHEDRATSLAELRGKK
jgi:hypothetical protein